MTIRLLYVDDEPDLREVASLSLELDPELEVRTCGSGDEALAVLAQWRPELILLDVMMPGMDGPATLAAIGERLADAPPVVFITARAGEADTRRLMALGARGVIPKPFDPMTLAETVRGFLPDA